MEIAVNSAGRQLGGRYNILYPISETIMSMVYRAWDIQNNCPVVVKAARNSTEQPYLVHFLENEAVALKHFNHPGIVRLVDSGQFEEWFFIVLEYIDGPVISQCFRKRHPLPADCGVFVMVGVLEALHHANQMGFVHCDIKPQNVMVTSDSIVKLIDFGLAKPIYAANDSRKHPITDGTLSGTAPYLSPEQAFFSDLDCRSDVYSCGVFLYCMLTGKFPFPVSRFMENGRLLRYWDMPMQLFSDTPFVPYNVQDVVRKALQTDPGNRHQSVEEMRLALLDAFTLPSIDELKLGRWGKIVGEVTQPIKISEPK